MLNNTTGRQTKTLFGSVFSTISYKNGLFHFLPDTWSCNSDSCDFFYNRGWFIIDLVAAIPFDLLLFGSDTDEVAINIKFTITKTRNMDFWLLDSLTYNHSSNILFLNLILSFLRVTRRWDVLQKILTNANPIYVWKSYLNIYFVSLKGQL